MPTEMPPALVLSYVGVKYVAPPSVESSIKRPGAALTSETVAGQVDVAILTGNGVESARAALLKAIA